ncbi:fructose-bisphosphatase class III, partial [Staphylococcus epidermidis]|uniref:fructose-bisphosphatase class III n=1 Tax=Staphylococcus epidermidis TaxID=1282 RepID=UPI0021B3DA9A
MEHKPSHKHQKNPYYYLPQHLHIIPKILNHFPLNPHQPPIINPHTPLKQIHPQHPIKPNPKILLIHPPFSKPYQSTTPIPPYTLLYNSFRIQLVPHKHFNTKQKVLS